LVEITGIRIINIAVVYTLAAFRFCAFDVSPIHTVLSIVVEREFSTCTKDGRDQG
jgi:hypothetical protein